MNRGLPKQIKWFYKHQFFFYGLRIIIKINEEWK